MKHLRKFKTQEEFEEFISNLSNDSEYKPFCMGPDNQLFMYKEKVYEIETEFNIETPSKPYAKAVGLLFGVTSMTIDGEEIDLMNDIRYDEDLETGVCDRFTAGTHTVVFGLSSNVIENGTFLNCASMTKITIPSEIIEIGDDIFGNYCSINNITVDERNSYYNDGNGSKCIIHSESDTLMYTANSAVIPATVRSITEYAFTTYKNEVLKYDGTLSQWYAIEKYDESIKYSSNIKVVQCGDGNVVGFINQNEIWVGVASGHANDFIDELDDYEYFPSFYSSEDDSVQIFPIDNPEAVGDYVKIKFTGNIRHYYTDDWNMFPYEYMRSVILPEGLRNISGYSFYDTDLEHIYIPNTVTSIGYYAFSECSSLASIEIPDSVTLIGESAFSECSSLASIEIPDSVTFIGGYAFDYCSSLANITVGENNQKYDSRNNCNAIIETATNTLIAGCKNTVIPNTVTSIGEGAFSGCSSLTSIEIPDSVTSIGTYAFQSCSSLASIEIPDSVTSIGSYTFQSCWSLEDIVIGNGVTSIGNYAFYDCSSLASIEIGNGVTSIGNYAFSGCSSLESITCYAFTSPLLDYYVFNNIRSAGTLFVFEGTNYDEWMDYGGLGYMYWDIEYIPFTINNITNKRPISTVYANTTKVVVEFNVNLTTIDGQTKDIIERRLLDEDISPNTGETPVHVESTFTFNNTQYNVEFDQLAEEGVADYQIFYTSNEDDIIEVSGLYGFGARIIDNTYKNGHGEITFNRKVTSIGEEAFYNCSSLTSIDIPDSVTSIGDYAFQYCSSLTDIEIPDSVTSIGDGAFYGCSSLAYIKCNGNSAPKVYYATFGDNEGTFTGRNTYDQGINVLEVPDGAAGYNKRYWKSVLCNSDKCGFTLIGGEDSSSSSSDE